MTRLHPADIAQLEHSADLAAQAAAVKIDRAIAAHAAGLRVVAMLNEWSAFFDLEDASALRCRAQKAPP